MPLDGQTLGHYHLQRVIGRGGMGEVYLAEDTRIGRQVAVKVVLTEPGAYPDEQATKDTRRLFEREMKAIAALDHPHILPLYDFGETLQDNLLIAYMVMPYRPEGSLSDWLRKRGTGNFLSPEEVSYFISQAADALQDAHEHHLIHQDVKPSNFLVREKVETTHLPDILLADFSIAIFTNITPTASVRGTPAYMPPEQWKSEPVVATDQYALAIMAYLLLTGRLPFEGRMEQIMHQQFTVTPQPPGNFNPEISDGTNAVILRALAKKPEDRFATISDFSRAFKDAINFQDVPLAHVSPKPEIVKPPITTANLGSPSTIDATPTPKQDVELPITTANTGSSSTIDATPTPKQENKFSESQIRLNAKVLLILGLTILVLITSIFGFSAYQNHANQINVDATVAANSATNQAIKANATTTSLSQLAMATATEQSIILANPYPSYLSGSGTLAMYDSLSYQDNWNTKSDANHNNYCQYNNGNFIVTESRAKTFLECSENTVFTNFAFEVRMEIIQGDCGGILFRGDYRDNRYFYYKICSDGSYLLYAYTNSNGDGHILIQSNKPDPDIKGLGQYNTIAVVANGNSITIYVNSHSIGSILNGLNPGGQLALFAKDEGNSTQVAFRNARVWTLQ